MKEDILIVRVRERDRVARMVRPLLYPLKPAYPCDAYTSAQAVQAMQGMFDKWIRCRTCGQWTDEWMVCELFGVCGICRDCGNGDS